MENENKCSKNKENLENYGKVELEGECICELNEIERLGIHKKLSFQEMVKEYKKKDQKLKGEISLGIKES